MSIRVAINGYGRIGRNILRGLYESGYRNRIEVVAINDLGDPQINAHLTRFDSVHGPFTGNLSIEDDQLVIGQDRIKMLNQKDPAELPWRQLDVDVVFECTGRFTCRDQAKVHLSSGAKRVIISAPATGADATIVYGINHHLLNSSHRIISSASCTTNCLAPVAKPLHDALGIERGLMTTIHAYTNDQSLSDLYHSDPYRARSATQSMIPTKTGAAKALGLVLPELDGRLDGMAVRVPTINVSLVDLTLSVSRNTSVAEVNAIMQEAARGYLSPVLAINELPLVSIDFNHCPYSATFDTTQTRVNGRLIKVMAWYDNEWGFSHRMLDNAISLMDAGEE
ncbi:type I glyceraldehyde-3-phosphate dehydrogenase [Aestuariirhabdus sp. LZHN29]|uniref:type I glyceraldehyde-3-phosphate dehydrogenase n=1 Tax=Aestuariirhabdus sp. LZHN29 TaxID=3417462 RepID=UPI003CF25623